MGKNKVLDIIIEFVYAVKNSTDVVSVNNGRDYRILSPKYLLGQIIRQYDIPPEQYFISESAEELWNKISNDDIWNYTYRAPIKCDSINAISVFEYRGNENLPKNERSILKGDTFVFRDVFHDEHMIPIRVIIEQLISLENPSYDNVEEILKHIHICRMLKTEDRKIYPKSNRAYDLDAVKQLYAENGIRIIKRGRRSFC